MCVRTRARVCVCIRLCIIVFDLLPLFSLTLLLVNPQTSDVSMTTTKNQSGPYQQYFKITAIQGMAYLC